MKISEPLQIKTVTKACDSLILRNKVKKKCHSEVGEKEKFCFSAALLGLEVCCAQGIESRHVVMAEQPLLATTRSLRFGFKNITNSRFSINGHFYVIFCSSCQPFAEKLSNLHFP